MNNQKQFRGVDVVVDFANTRISNIVNQYHCENEKVLETVVACLYGAQKECFKLKIGVETLVKLSL